MQDPHVQRRLPVAQASVEVAVPYLVAPMASRTDSSSLQMAFDVLDVPLDLGRYTAWLRDSGGLKAYRVTSERVGGHRL